MRGRTRGAQPGPWSWRGGSRGGGLRSPPPRAAHCPEAASSGHVVGQGGRMLGALAAAGKAAVALWARGPQDGERRRLKWWEGLVSTCSAGGPFSKVASNLVM